MESVFKIKQNTNYKHKDSSFFFFFFSFGYPVALLWWQSTSHPSNASRAILGSWENFAVLHTKKIIGFSHWDLTFFSNSCCGTMEAEVRPVAIPVCDASHRTPNTTPEKTHSEEDIFWSQPPEITQRTGFRTSYALCTYVLVVFESISQTAPAQGVHSAEPHELVKNGGILDIWISAQHPLPATFS